MTRGNRYKTLYYFTESYPYGISEQWKRNELEVFRNHFERIVVVPRSYGGNPTARNLVEGVEYKEPLFATEMARGLGEKLRLQASALTRPLVLKGLIKSAANRVEFARILKHAYQIELMLQSPALGEILGRGERSPAILYFYWALGTADIIPFVGRSDDIIVSRFHGWDLYEERHPGGAIPFRRELIDALDLALPCSDFGARYLRRRYPEAGLKIQTARLGTLGRGRNRSEQDGVLKIVTCSAVTRVKRLDRLSSALKSTALPVRWTHIGDGELMPEIRESAAGLPGNIKVEFLGNIPSEDVLDVLVSRPFDIFLNVSESEGVPVSIMEGLSAGIPVFATDVGGTSEIVDDSVGKLLPANGDPERIAAELANFNELPVELKLELREAAYMRYQECCNGYTNAERLAELIISRKDWNRK